MGRPHEASALGMRAAEAGEVTEDGLAAAAPLAISCWCVQPEQAIPAGRCARPVQRVLRAGKYMAVPTLRKV